MRLSLNPIAAVAGATLLLAGCGTLPGDRAVSGAAIGAAGGLVVGALTAAPLAGATIVGAAAGAAVGALTNPAVIDLGPPPWR